MITLLFSAFVSRKSKPSLNRQEKENTVRALTGTCHSPGSLQNVPRRDCAVLFTVLAYRTAITSEIMKTRHD